MIALDMRDPIKQQRTKGNYVPFGYGKCITQLGCGSQNFPWASLKLHAIFDWFTFAPK